MGGTTSKVWREISRPFQQPAIDVLRGKSPDAPAPAPAAEAQAGLGDRITVKKQRRGATATVRTSPLGIGGEAAVAHKTLLGQ
jgi:hypothetical protein